MIYLFDAAATPRYNPDFLMGEPTVTATPKQVVTYQLNPKAIWYDGTPITAADYIALWKSQNGTNNAYKVSGTQGYDQIENVVQGANKYEVVMTYKTPYADWKGLFWPLYPASTSNDPNVFNNGWKDKLLTSAGPFRFESYDATAKIYTLVPNEKWWGNKPKLDVMVYRVLDNDAMPGAIANGEIDMMDVGPNANYYNKVKTVHGYRHPSCRRTQLPPPDDQRSECDVAGRQRPAGPGHEYRSRSHRARATWTVACDTCSAG